MHRLINRGGPTLGAIAPTTKKKSLKIIKFFCPLFGKFLGPPTAHQACGLRSDLEQSLKDNASLFVKIAREDKLNAGNRSVVNKFESELTQDIKSLSKINNLNALKTVNDLKKKVCGSKALYVSHLEALQNVVVLHKAYSNANLEEVLSLTSSNAFCVEKLLAEEASEGLSIFDELHGSLSTQQGETAHFARELRQRFNVSFGHTTDISNFINEFFDKLISESIREVNSLVTRGFDSNEQHDAEISSLRATAEHDVLENSENISTQFNGWW
ncbi:unnamed protein product [Lactuca saligna]|uniref:Uncharacterized protein n=1 Tax=Lactuca saligna TaxID=75948 RepID=A0AA36EMF2_LACSI|nr:unnamed protein product [Lactuca saligna]